MTNTINTNELIKFLVNSKESKYLEIEQAYTIYMQHVKQFNRQGTYRYYTSCFKSILKFLKIRNIDRTNLITKQTIIDYISFRQLQNVSNNTINKETTALHTMLKVLTDLEFIDMPNISIKKLKVIKPEIKTISKEDLSKILDLIKSYSLFSQAIVLLLISTGIRTSELINIKNSNIDFKNKTIYLEFTKTNNTRYIFFDTKTSMVLEQIYNKNNIYLFTNDKTNKQMTPSGVSSLIARIKKTLHIDVLSPHKLRHTYATILIENGADMESVRLLLGHSTYEMTKRYLHLTNDKIKETNNALNPLNILKRE